MEVKDEVVNYYTTQALTGHGCFGEYLKSIKKIENDNCWFCNDPDTREHTVFKCTRFAQEREEANKNLKLPMNIGNVSEILTESQQERNTLVTYLETIMKLKEEEEKKRKTRIEP